MWDGRAEQRTQVWWLIPVISAQRVRQEASTAFRASLGYMASSVNLGYNMKLVSKPNQAKQRTKEKQRDEPWEEETVLQTQPGARGRGKPRSK